MRITKLHDKINQINVNEKQCTQAILKEWKKTLPFYKKNILLNCHLTTATLILLELFLEAGAEIKITCIGNLVCHKPIKDLVIELGVYLDFQQIMAAHHQNFYDVIIDCGAYLANILQPKKGFVELTHVDKVYYKTTRCPVISIDDSVIKQLETTYGTGDGFVRAISLIYSHKNQKFQEKSYMIFGFGKVGKGICFSLLDARVPITNIIVIETDKQNQISAQSQGFSAYSLYKDRQCIINLLSNTINCVVTATGIEECISKTFSSSIFANVECLANMGTYDEWGHSFSEDRILYHKKPVNFMLEYPTKILYLDPIFALLACATLDMIEDNLEWNELIQKPREETERKILTIWIKNNKPSLNLKNFLEEKIRDNLHEKTTHTYNA